MNTFSLKYKKITAVLMVSFLSFFPRLVAAQCDSTQEICNPLQADNITEFLGELVNAITYLSIPIIVFFIIYAGFLFVTAGGDTTQIEQARKTALYTVIGAAIILGASLIADILTNTAENLGVDNLD